LVSEPRAHLARIPNANGTEWISHIHSTASKGDVTYFSVTCAECQSLLLETLYI